MKLEAVAAAKLVLKQRLSSPKKLFHLYFFHSFLCFVRRNLHRVRVLVRQLLKMRLAALFSMTENLNSNKNKNDARTLPFLLTTMTKSWISHNTAIATVEVNLIL